MSLHPPRDVHAPAASLPSGVLCHLGWLGVNHACAPPLAVSTIHHMLCSSRGTTRRSGMVWFPIFTVVKLYMWKFSVEGWNSPTTFRYTHLLSYVFILNTHWSSLVLDSHRYPKHLSSNFTTSPFGIDTLVAPCISYHSFPWSTYPYTIWLGCFIHTYIYIYVYQHTNYVYFPTTATPDTHLQLFSQLTQWDS